MKKKTPKNSNSKELNNLRHVDEYAEFISWITLPYSARDPKTQIEFSKKFGVGQDTLSEWKQRKGFVESVKKKRYEWGRERTPEVIQALFKRISKTGGAPEVKLWFQIIEEWSEKITTDSKEENPLRSLSNAELAEKRRLLIKFLLKK